MALTNQTAKNGFDTPTGNGRDNAPFLNEALVPMSVTFAIAAGTTNEALITCTVKDGHGNAMTSPVPINVWLSDAADGEGLTATTASGAVAAGTSGGAVLGTLTTKKALLCQTTDAGVFILSITDSAKTGFYVAAASLFTGQTNVSAQLVTGNYG